MSGDVHLPRVTLLGEETRRIVAAIPVVAGLSGTTPTVVGGLAVLCRVAQAHRATTDLDALSRREPGTKPLLELLLDSPGSRPRDAAGAEVRTPSGPVKVDVIEVSERSDVHVVENPTDRLYEMAHAWAWRTASAMEIVVAGARGTAGSVARVAEPGPLLAMKLQAVRDRERRKQGTDLLDIVTLVLDRSVRDVALEQLRRADPTIASDCALHAREWFAASADWSLRRIHEAGARSITREELALVGDLLRAVAE